jgi:dienelactone hydrolase
VSWEEDTSYQLGPETIDSLLGQYGYPFFSPLQYGTRIFRVRYVTQDHGKTREATAIVGVPDPVDGQGKSFPTVLWTHGTTGFSDGCAPSMNLEGIAFPLLWAALGYVAVAPDYLGMAGFGASSEMSHPYLIGEATAIASWDAVRAAEILLTKEVQTAATFTRNVILWGASQGGHAVFMCERYAPYLAPEYKVIGAVAAIPPTDLVHQAEQGLLYPGSTAATLSAFYTAAMKWYGYPASLAGVLTDTDPKHFMTALPEFFDHDCDPGDLFDNITKIDQVYEQSFLDAAAIGIENLEPWGCFLSDNSIETSRVQRVSDTPFLFILSEKDSLVIPEVERTGFDTLCGQGYRMDYIECAGASHAQGAIWSLPAQHAWIEDRLAGKPLDVATVCRRTPAQECSGKPTN